MNPRSKVPQIIEGPRWALDFLLLTSARVKSYQLVKRRIGRPCAWKKFNFGITTTFNKCDISLFCSRASGKKTIFVLHWFLKLIFDHFKGANAGCLDISRSFTSDPSPGTSPDPIPWNLAVLFQLIYLHLLISYLSISIRYMISYHVRYTLTIFNVTYWYLMIFVIMSYLYFIEDLTPAGAEPQPGGPGSAPGLDGAAAAADLGQGRAPHTARRPWRQRQRRQRQRGDPGAGGADGAGTAGICQLGMLRLRFMDFGWKLENIPPLIIQIHPLGSRIPGFHSSTHLLRILLRNWLNCLMDGGWVAFKSADDSPGRSWFIWLGFAGAFQPKMLHDTSVPKEICPKFRSEKNGAALVSLWVYFTDFGVWPGVAGFGGWTRMKRSIF